MSITNTGNNIRKAIVAGSYTSSTLNTLLSNADMLSSFKHMLNSDFSAQLLFQNSSSFDVIFNSSNAWNAVLTSEIAIKGILKSELATKIIASNSSYVQTVVNNDDFMNIYKSNDAYKTLRNHVNKSYSKLKRYILTASDTFVVSSNLPLLSALLIGGGGDGGVIPSVGWGLAGGGGAGEMVCVNYSNVVAGSYSVVIASTGDTTINITGIVTAHKGDKGRTILGTTPSGSSLGGGNTTNNGYKNLSDFDLLNAAFQKTAFTQRGGDGECLGLGGINTTQGYFKELNGFHQSILNGQCGKGFISGGISNTSTDRVAEKAEDGSGCGGGAFIAGSTPYANGSSGLVIFYYIEA